MKFFLRRFVLSGPEVLKIEFSYRQWITGVPQLFTPPSVIYPRYLVSLSQISRDANDFISLKSHRFSRGNFKLGHFTNGVGIKTTIIYPPYLVSQNAPQGGGK